MYLESGLPDAFAEGEVFAEIPVATILRTNDLLLVKPCRVVCLHQKHNGSKVWFDKSIYHSLEYITDQKKVLPLFVFNATR